MAKQLYDYWFVQFDFPNEEGKPYKSSGGAMVWNEKLKREIPQGWSNGVLSDVANITMGQSPDGSSYNEDGEGIIFYQGSTDFGLRFPDIRQYTTSPSRYANKGDILMSVRAPVGALNIANNDCCIGRGLSALSSKIGSMTHLYYLLNDFRLKFDGMNSAGTTFGSITKDELFSLPVIIPTKSVISEFEQVCEPIFDKQMIIGEEINALTKQRDELLPLLMNGQATVNYHLSASFLSSLILYRDQYKFYDMKETIIQTVLNGMRAVLTENQLDLLTDVTRKALSECEITPKATEEEQRNKENVELLGAFISSKKVEGCSDKTIHYYKSSIEKLIATVKKNVCDIATNDIRCYLAEQQEQRGLSKVTIDNLRRIYSSFFSWLEDEDYITKSPVRRIHKVRTDALVKEVLTDENIEVLRDSCQELRDIAMIDLLLSTGMRVGELVKINRDDIDFQERQCVVFGKGNKEREVYFNARTKIHLKKYLEQRTDTNPALFVSLHEPHTRLTISGVEVRLRQLGKRVNLNKVHPHKFRRTLATMAIDKGMPIEQVQKMLGHVKIDTTLHYAMVNQTNVKIAHRKFLN
jgi:site-specific recombinase XerD